MQEKISPEYDPNVIIIDQLDIIEEEDEDGNEIIHLVAATRNDTPASLDALAEAALEELTGISPEWLAGVKPFFLEILAKAEDESVSEADFVEVLKAAQSQLPEVFERFDTAALQSVLERVIGTSMLAGAVNQLDKAK